MKASRPGRRGMTLIELLIVMVIIGVLVSLLLPATVKMRNRAAGAKEKTMRVTFINAVLNYHAEYGEWPVSPQPTSRKEVLSAVVIPKLRSYGNPRGKNFWEGDDKVTTIAGKEYTLVINPAGIYPVGGVDEFSSAYTVSVVVK